MSYYKSVVSKLGTRGLIVMGLISVGFASIGVYAATDSENNCDRSSYHREAGKDGEGYGGDGHRWSRGEHHFHARALDLTDTQKQTLKDFRTAQEPAQKELHEKIRVAREALSKAGEANANDDTLNKLALDMAKLQAQREVARVKSRQQLVAVLTPEQKQKLSQLDADRGDFKQRKHADKK